MIWILQLILIFSNGERQTIDLKDVYESRIDCEHAMELVNTALEYTTLTPPGLQHFTTNCVPWRANGN